MKSLETIFVEARAIANPAERAAFLVKACANDHGLQAKVEAMLCDAEGADAFFQPLHPLEAGDTQKTIVLPKLSENEGTIIGRYKLLQRIGEGGMGVVYMAEQREPVVRKVALKIIKLGMDTKQVIARFEAERQALALMDHPNIAKVLDGGETAAGRPYFVMELVQGLPVTQFCDDAKLPTGERLRLFIEICSAVQHAHQKGIIHRDLKPSNILVTLHGDKPVPKVIDFGVAKATQGRLTDKTVFTQFQQFIGTPAYMSPEQTSLSGLDVDTRSDVYSLGVLLYELLIGKTPFDTKELLKAGLDEMRQIIREQEPPKPSTRLSTMQGDDLTTTAKHRHTEPPKLIHLVRGDLDWIVMKCLEKDRARRYETANGLAMDLQRHLLDEPVVACPPSVVYRFERFARRNRLAFAAAGAVAMALMVGSGLSTWLFYKEKEARQRAVAAEEEQTGLRQDAEARRMNETVLREEAENARDNEAKFRRQAEVAERVAQAEASQLGEALLQLGKLSEAEAFIRRALAMQRKTLGSECPEVAASLNNLGNVLIRQGKDLKGAESACRESVAVRKQILGAEHPDVATSLDRLGVALLLQGSYVEAEGVNSEALAIRRKALGNQHMDTANSLQNLGWVLRLEGKYAEAESAYSEALGVARTLLGNEHPYVHSTLNILANVVIESGRPADAEPLVRECLAIRQKKSPDDWLTFATQSLLGDVLLLQQRFDEAEPLLLSSCQAMNEREADTPEATRVGLRKAVERLARLYEVTGRADEATEWRKSLAALNDNSR